MMGGILALVSAAPLLLRFAIDIMQAILLYFMKYNLLREAESDLILATIFVTAIAAPLQNSRVFLTIRILAGPLPALLLVGAIVCAVFYPLNRDQFDELIRRLEQRRDDS